MQIYFLFNNRCCEIALQQVRLLLYKECDIRGRKVLFDSSTIERLPAEKNDKPNFKHAEKVPCILEVSDGHKYIVSKLFVNYINLDIQSQCWLV